MTPEAWIVAVACGVALALLGFQDYALPWMLVVIFTGHALDASYSHVGIKRVVPPRPLGQ